MQFPFRFLRWQRAFSIWVYYPSDFHWLGSNFEFYPPHLSSLSTLFLIGIRLQEVGNYNPTAMPLVAGPPFIPLCLSPSTHKIKWDAHTAPVWFHPGIELLSIFTLILCATSTPRNPRVRGLATAVRSVMDTGLQLTRVHTLYTKALRKIMEWVMEKKYHYLIKVP